MNLSVVIPAYNEEENIRDVIFDVLTSLPEAEIIVVNDASTDRTLEILNSRNIPNLKVLTNEKNMGHGYSVVRGLRTAQGDYILYIDADRQIGIDNIGISGFDILSGVRIRRQDKLFRKIISFCLKTTILLRYGYYVRDANCPFKIYNSASIKSLLDRLPDTNIIPIACLEVLARKHNLLTATTLTPHLPYRGVRKGFLQGLNLKTLKFTVGAFFEIINL